MSMVEDVRGMGEHNWTEATWMFLVEAIEETQEEIRSTRNL